MAMFKVREGYGYQQVQPDRLPILGAGEYVELADINVGDQAWKLQEATPPAEVTGLATDAGLGEVTLTWTDPVDTDLASIEITCDFEGIDPVLVDAGVETALVTGLEPLVEVTFTVKTIDALGNKSIGVTIAETPVAPGP